LGVVPLYRVYHSDNDMPPSNLYTLFYTILSCVMQISVALAWFVCTFILLPQYLVYCCHSTLYTAATVPCILLPQYLAATVPCILLPQYLVYCLLPQYRFNQHKGEYSILDFNEKFCKSKQKMNCTGSDMSLLYHFLPFW